MPDVIRCVVSDMLASWEKDVDEYRIAADADLQQAVQVVTVMKHAPAAYRDLLQVVPVASRETHQTLRAYVREWTLAQRTYDDLGRHMAHDTLKRKEVSRCEYGHRGKWRRKRAQCRKQKDQGGKPLAATVKAVATVSRIQSFSSHDDSFWVSAVSAR